MIYGQKWRDAEVRRNFGVLTLSFQMARRTPSLLNHSWNAMENAVVDGFVYFQGSGDDAFSSRQPRAEKRHLLRLAMFIDI